MGASITNAAIFIILLCILFNSNVKSDNPTAIVTPYSGPDPGYVLAESDGGLSNRLRVLAAYMYIAESKFDGAHLAVSLQVIHLLFVYGPKYDAIFNRLFYAVRVGC
jgi:hypothetical protein